MDEESIAQYLRDSLKQNSLTLHYQPQFCLVGECFVVGGMEALLRPDTSVCHTEKLVDVAIKTNQITELGYWILKQVAHQVRYWRDKNLVTSAFTASVNVAGEQLQDENFCENMHRIIAEAEIEPHQITLELVESSLIDDHNIAKIFNLSSIGFNISIDDFGTGYSSFNRLKILPVQEIKIDKMFVDDITKTEQDVALITAMYQLTHALNKFTIVEGVESRRQYDILRDIGFTCFQGYFFDKAESPEDIEKTLTLINSLHFRPCRD